jgi:hypothetical protein
LREVGDLGGCSMWGTCFITKLYFILKGVVIIIKYSLKKDVQINCVPLLQQSENHVIHNNVAADNVWDSGSVKQITNN